MKNNFLLKSIDDGLAVVESTGRIATDSSAASIPGYQANSNLTGTENGYYEINTKTGMLENCNISTKIEGGLIAVGREIPISISIKTKIEVTQKEQ